MASDWFNTDAQQALFQSTAERSLMIVKQAQAQRMQAELNKLNDKYDGKAAAGIEEQINKMGDEKQALAQWLSSVDDGLQKFNTAREYMLQAEGTLAQAAPSPDAFNTYYDALNSYLYNEKFDKTSLVSNTNNHRGTWESKTDTVLANGMTADVTHHYLGNDFVIELDGGGGLMEPNTKGALTGGGHTITRANLKLVSRDASDRVEFQDVTDPANPVTYTGQLKRGGLGVLPAWLYGNLSDPAVKAEAKADFKAGYKKLARFELDFNVDQAQLSGMDNALASKMENLQGDYERVANAEVDAKLAEKKAIETRFQIYNNALALSSATTTSFISQMFNTPATTQDLTDVLLGAVKPS